MFEIKVCFYNLQIPGISNTAVIPLTSAINWLPPNLNQASIIL